MLIITKPQEVNYACVIPGEDKLPDASEVGDTYLACLVHEGTGASGSLCANVEIYPGQIW